MNNVLVTGGAGFIGSHICDALIEKNFNVFVIDNLSTGKIENLNKKVSFFKIDITNQSALEDFFKDNQIDYIFHFAAQSNVKKSIKNPVQDAKINIIGTINLINFAKKYNVKKIISASTAAVYGNQSIFPISEDTKLNPVSSYGISKFAMELYLQNSGINFTILRYSNVYGSRQETSSESGVVSIFMNKLYNDKTIKIYGDGEQSRDFIFIKDVVEANIKAINKDCDGNIFNISTAKSTSINNLCKIINENIGNKILKVKFVKERAGDINHSVLDNSKAIKFGLLTNTTNIMSGLKILSLDLSNN